MSAWPIIVLGYVFAVLFALRFFAVGAGKCDRPGCDCARNDAHPHSIATGEKRSLAVGQGKIHFHSQGDKL